MEPNLPKLEREALEHAREAVELDRKGLRSLAIIRYRKAVEALTQIVQSDPNSPLNRTYMRKIREYRDRIQFLRGMVAEDARAPGSVKGIAAETTKSVNH